MITIDEESAKAIAALMGNYITSICTDRNNTIIAASCRNDVFRVWDFETGRVKRTFKGHTALVKQVLISPCEKFYFSSSKDGTIKKWDLKYEMLLDTMEGHTDWVRTIAIDKAAKYIVSGSDDRTVRIWDLKTCKVVKTLDTGGNAVAKVFIDENENKIIAVTFAKTILFWDKHSYNKVNELRCKLQPDAPSYIDYRNNRIAVVGAEHIEIMDVLTKHVDLVENMKDIYSIKFNNDAKTLICGGNKFIKYWDIEKGKCCREIKCEGGLIDVLHCSSDERYLLTSGGIADNTIRIWDYKSGHLLNTIKNEDDELGNQHLHNSVNYRLLSVEFKDSQRTTKPWWKFW